MPKWPKWLKSLVILVVSICGGFLLLSFVDSRYRLPRTVTGEVRTEWMEFTLLRKWLISSSSTKMVTHLILQNCEIRVKNIDHISEDGKKEIIKSSVLIQPPATEEGLKVSKSEGLSLDFSPVINRSRKLELSWASNDSRSFEVHIVSKEPKLRAFILADNIGEVDIPPTYEVYDNVQHKKIDIDQYKQNLKGKVEIELRSHEKGRIAMNFHYPQKISETQEEKIVLIEKSFRSSTFKDIKFRASSGTSINLGIHQQERQYKHKQVINIFSDEISLTEDLTVDNAGMHFLFSAEETNSLTLNNEQQIQGVISDFLPLPTLYMSLIVGAVIVFIQLLLSKKAKEQKDLENFKNTNF